MTRVWSAGGSGTLKSNMAECSGLLWPANSRRSDLPRQVCPWRGTAHSKFRVTGTRPTIEEQSRNNRGTIEEQSRNNRGTIEEQSRNNRGTIEEQSSTNRAPIETTPRVCVLYRAGRAMCPS